MGKTGCIKDKVCFVPSSLHGDHYPEPVQLEPEPVLVRGLDDAYNENMLDILLQIPTVVFTYWEISDYQQQAIGRDKELYLRLYELISEKLIIKSQMVKEALVSPVGSYYFTELNAGRSYYCELGWYINGVFYSCLQSKIIETPWIDKYPYEKRTPDAGKLELEDKMSLYNRNEINSMMLYMGVHLK